MTRNVGKGVGIALSLALVLDILVPPGGILTLLMPAFLVAGSLLIWRAGSAEALSPHEIAVQYKRVLGIGLKLLGVSGLAMVLALLLGLLGSEVAVFLFIAVVSYLVLPGIVLTLVGMSHAATAWIGKRMR